MIQFFFYIYKKMKILLATPFCMVRVPVLFLVTFFPKSFSANVFFTYFLFFTMYLVFEGIIPAIFFLKIRGTKTNDLKKKNTK